MLTDNIRLEKVTPVSTNAFWTIYNLDQKLKEDGTLQSDPFSFAGQEWRLLLSRDEMLDQSYIEFTLSRITISDECNPTAPLVFWEGGIIDTEGTSQYSRTGFASLETTFKEWMTVADWPGPEYTHLCMRKDLLMPEEKLTVVIQLRLDSGSALTTDAHPFISEESPLDKSTQVTSLLLTDDELASIVDDDEVIADVDTSFSIDPQPSISGEEIKRKYTGYGRKRRKIYVTEEALKNVLKETTDRILKFQEEAEKAAEEKREQFREKILKQNQQMINLLRTIALK